MERKTFWTIFKHSSRGYSPRQFAVLCGYKGAISDKEESTEHPERVKVDPNLVRDPIRVVWSQIYSDMERNAEIGGWKLTNLVAIETCLDCDNIKTFCQEGTWVHKNQCTDAALKADAEIERATDQFGYRVVLEYLSQKIQLV